MAHGPSRCPTGRALAALALLGMTALLGGCYAYPAEPGYGYYAGPGYYSYPATGYVAVGGGWHGGWHDHGWHDHDEWHHDH